MAANQIKRHKIGRKGEKIANEYINGEITAHKAPFDIVDFNARIGYEVKTMSGYAADLKIHITDNSMARKREFAQEWGLNMTLIAVVIYSPTKIEVYESVLVQCIRVNQMRRVQ